jgi:iron-sulfur cluster assembly accessory protein
MTETEAIAVLEMSERAADRILVVLEGEAPGSALRISVDGGGCSGLQYSYSVETAPKPEDIAIARGGAKIVVDPVSYAYLAGSRVDFVDDLMGRSFRIENPKAASSCGCGSSFSV